MSRDVPPRIRFKVCGLLLTVLLIAFAFGSPIFSDNHVSAASNGPSFVEFESGQVRPIAMSPDGNTLFAVNTPNGTLEIFNVTAGGLAFQARVPVGMSRSHRATKSPPPMPCRRPRYPRRSRWIYAGYR